MKYVLEVWGLSLLPNHEEVSIKNCLNVIHKWCRHSNIWSYGYKYIRKLLVIEWVLRSSDLPASSITGMRYTSRNGGCFSHDVTFGPTAYNALRKPRETAWEPIKLPLNCYKTRHLEKRRRGEDDFQFVNLLNLYWMGQTRVVISKLIMWQTLHTSSVSKQMLLYIAVWLISMYISKYQLISNFKNI